MWQAFSHSVVGSVYIVCQCVLINFTRQQPTTFLNPQASVAMATGAA